MVRSGVRRHKASLVNDGAAVKTGTGGQREGKALTNRRHRKAKRKQASTGLWLEIVGVLFAWKQTVMAACGLKSSSCKYTGSAEREKIPTHSTAFHGASTAQDSLKALVCLPKRLNRPPTFDSLR